MASEISLKDVLKAVADYLSLWLDFTKRFEEIRSKNPTVRLWIGDPKKFKDLVIEALAQARDSREVGEATIILARLARVTLPSFEAFLELPEQDRKRIIAEHEAAVRRLEELLKEG